MKQLSASTVVVVRRKNPGSILIFSSYIFIVQEALGYIESESVFVVFKKEIQKI